MTAGFDEAAYVRTLVQFPPHPIRDDEDNDRAIAMLQAIDALPERTAEQVALAEVLTTLVRSFEARYALEGVSGAVVLRELMLANDLKRKDLEDIASRGMLADIFAGRREISKALAKKLAERFSVAYTVFL